MMTQFVNVDNLQHTTLDDFIMKAEALVADARRHGFSIVMGIDTPEKPYIVSNTTLDTSDTLFMTVVGLAVRHPGVLTIPQMQDKLNRLEEDAETLKAAGVPYVIGIQPEPTGKLQILSNLPEGSLQPLHSAHLDMTIADPDMFGDTLEDIECP